MSLMLFSTLATLGGIGGFAAGLLGFGGGVVMFPLLFYIPPLVGLERLDVKTVAALVVSQVFFATMIGGSAHWRSGRVHGRLTLIGAVASASGSFLGGVATPWVSDHFLLPLFGIITLLVVAIMFLPSPTAEQEEVPLGKVVVSLPMLSVVSFAVGVVVGLLGAGNFVLVPLMIYVLRVPTRIAIGSSLFIAMLNTFSGFLGKLLTGQIPFLMALVVALGTGVGATAGEWTHSRLSVPVLRYVYAGMVGAITVRIWITLLL